MEKLNALLENKDILAAEEQLQQILKLLRVLRIVCILRIFTKLKGLNKLCRALGFCLVPMCNAFFLLLIATSVYAVFGTNYFGERSLIIYGRVRNRAVHISRRKQN